MPWQLILIHTQNMKSAAAFVMVILSGFLPRLGGATVYQSNGSAQDIQRLHGMASDGDTITLPVGTFSWTSRVNITKGITLQGETTIVGPSTNPTVTDATIIRDNTPRTGTRLGIINASLIPSQSFRLTGITFVAGTSTIYANGNGAIQLNSVGSSPNTSMRVDHCHFHMLYHSYILWIYGWVYGVDDHNVFNCQPASLSHLVWHHTYGGTSQIKGNGSWADYPWFGTSKFWFIEDNTITGNGPLTSGNIDAKQGGRYVSRHNAWYNARPNSHGTEAGSQRGVRAIEIYDDTYTWTINNGGSELRSGALLAHDNYATGIEPNRDEGPMNGTLQRVLGAQAGPQFPPAAGQTAWDQNAGADGITPVPARQSGYLFYSGLADGCRPVGGHGVVTVQVNPGWSTNQWIGYGIHNATQSDHRSGYITSNTTDTIRYTTYGGSPPLVPLSFVAGDSLQIHKPLVIMDQPGRGKGDQLSGATNVVNAALGNIRAWPRNQREPIYTWNNTWTSGATTRALSFGNGGFPTIIANQDYFNLGIGFPADTTPTQVAATYTAALNGVAYTGPFVYPHPLVTEAPTPTTDFNNDGKPDYLLFNSNTRDTVIWYLNNNVVTASTYGPTLPGGWSVAGVADFNRDGHTDCLLFNSSTRQTVIWYLNNNVVIGATYGPTLPGGWSVAGVADFNRDGHADYLLFNSSTRQTVIWYLNNNVVTASTYGPTLPSGWSVVAP